MKNTESNNGIEGFLENKDLSFPQTTKDLSTLKESMLLENENEGEKNREIKKLIESIKDISAIREDISNSKEKLIYNKMFMVSFDEQDQNKEVPVYKQELTLHGKKYILNFIDDIKSAVVGAVQGKEIIINIATIEKEYKELKGAEERAYTKIKIESDRHAIASIIRQEVFHQKEGEKNKFTDEDRKNPSPEVLKRHQIEEMYSEIESMKVAPKYNILSRIYQPMGNFIFPLYHKHKTGKDVPEFTGDQTYPYDLESTHGIRRGYKLMEICYYKTLQNMFSNKLYKKDFSGALDKIFKVYDKDDYRYEYDENKTSGGTFLGGERPKWNKLQGFKIHGTTFESYALFYLAPLMDEAFFESFVKIYKKEAIKIARDTIKVK